MKHRKLDSAYKPILTRTRLELPAEVLGEIKNFSTNGSGDRPLRDISLVRFCPALTKLHFFSR